MTENVYTPEQQRRIRQLRLQIARSRRRIDRRLRSGGAQGRAMFDWRSYVTRLPGSAVMAATGLGLVFAAGFGARRVARVLGVRMLRKSADNLVGWFKGELASLWRASDPTSTDARGGRHE